MKIKLFLIAVVAWLLPNAAFAEFKFCNDTNVKTYTAIAYSESGEWKSEGWWNMEPGECKRPIAADLTNRFYYFYAETSQLDFIKGDYAFCTINKVFEIIGDNIQDNCEDNGYEETLFHGVELTDETEVLVTLKRSGDTGVFQIRTVSNAPTKPDNPSDYLTLLQGTWSIDNGFGTGSITVTGNRYEDFFSSIFGTGGSEGTVSISDTCPHQSQSGPYVLKMNDDDPDELVCYRIKHITSSRAVFFDDFFEEEDIWYKSQ